MIKYLLQIATIAFTLISCNSKDEKQSPPTLSKEALSFNIDGSPVGENKFSITTNADWVASSDSDWCTLSRINGTGKAFISITVEPHKGFEQRTATITVRLTPEGVTSKLTVTQKANVYSLIVKGSPLVYLADGTQLNGNTITIKANAKWEATCSWDWCTLSQTSGDGDGSVDVTVAQNLSGERRLAVIYVKLPSGKLSHSILVQQTSDSNALIASTYSMNFTDDGNHIGLSNINLTANVDWVATCDVGWCTLSPTSGNGNATITVTADSNDSFEVRTATITIKQSSGALKETITVTQQAKEYILNATPLSLEFEPDGWPVNDSKVSVKCNAKWEASSNESWCKIFPSSGTGDGTVDIDVRENDSFYKRTATITIKLNPDQLSKRQTITITQQPKEEVLTVSPTELDFHPDGWPSNGSNTFSITSNTSWTVKSSHSWCSVNLSSGSGNATVYLSLSKNSSTSSREATVTVETKSGRVKRGISVWQAGVESD